MDFPPKILIATDGSEHARNACNVLHHLPLPSDAEITVLTVVPAASGLEWDTHADRSTLAEEANRIATAEVARLAELGRSAKSLVREGDVAEQIVDTANELGTSIITIGSHGTAGVAHFLIGGIAQKVVRHAPCSVLVGRIVDSASDGHKPVRILVAVDGSEPSLEAVELLASLPIHEQAEVIVLGILAVTTTLYGVDIVERTSPSWQTRKQEIHEILESAAERIRGTGAATKVILLEGGPDPSHEILQAADSEEVDMIVVGHTGKSGVSRFLLGSVSNRIVQHAKCSVLVVRPVSN